METYFKFKLFEEYINDNNEKDVYIEWLQDQIRLRDRFEEVE